MKLKLREKQHYRFYGTVFRRKETFERLKRVYARCFSVRSFLAATLLSKHTNFRNDTNDSLCRLREIFSLVTLNKAIQRKLCNATSVGSLACLKSSDSFRRSPRNTYLAF